MKLQICRYCGSSFDTKHDPRRKFCTLACCWEWRRTHKEQISGAFQEGNIPWNIGTKGIMKANTGSFSKGIISKNKQPLGALRIRQDKSGKSRYWIKVSEGHKTYDWKLRAIVVWESLHGSVPKRMIIHHRDRDSLNDSPDNLQAMTRAEHLREHREEFEERRRRAHAQTVCLRRHNTKHL